MVIHDLVILQDCSVCPKQLYERVQDLPPELFNNIYTLVFTASESTVDVTSSYKPPILLQVYRSSREVFSKSYYDAVTFRFDDRVTMLTWLYPLEESHARDIQTIRVTEPVWYTGNAALRPRRIRYLQDWIITEVEQDMTRMGRLLISHALCVDIKCIKETSSVNYEGQMTKATPEGFFDWIKGDW